MRFYFRPTDANLTKAANQGGCGVTDEELREIVVWQRNFDYQFEMHLENHGPYIYIFPDGRRAGQKNMPRFYFDGGKKGEFDGEESLSSGIRADVEEVVTNNYELFAAIHGRFYGTGGVAKAKAVSDVPAVAYFTCLNPGCAGRGQIIGVKFASQFEMSRQIKVSNTGSIRSAEFPVVRCPRKTCDWGGMELVEFGTMATSKPKEVIDFVA